MPRQINLCTPILLTQKRYFSAQTLLQALAVFVVVGGGLCAYWVWSLNFASEGFRRSLATQSRELESLQLALAQSKAGAAPIETAAIQELQARRAELAQREKIFEQSQRGRFRLGWGHAQRLQLLARSIPPQVWLTEVKADEIQLEVSGYTLEPAALNDWVGKLAASPLLEGQKLTTVKVENSGAAAVKTALRPIWSFNLVSAVGLPVTVVETKP